MKQSVEESAVEAMCNGLSTLCTSVALVLYIFPSLGLGAAVAISGVMLVKILIGAGLNTVRAFLWRRLFVHRNRDDDAILPRV